MPHPFIFRRKRILRSGVERSPAVRPQREDLPRKEQKAIAELKERVRRDWDRQPPPPIAGEGAGGEGADTPVATFGAHLCAVRTMFTSFVSSTAKRQRGLQRGKPGSPLPCFTSFCRSKRKSLPDRHTDNLKRLERKLLPGAHLWYNKSREEVPPDGYAKGSRAAKKS